MERLEKEPNGNRPNRSERNESRTGKNKRRRPGGSGYSGAKPPATAAGSPKSKNKKKRPFNAKSNRHDPRSGAYPNRPKLSKTGKFTPEEYTLWLEAKVAIEKALKEARLANIEAVNAFSENTDGELCAICSEPIAAMPDAISALTDKSGEKKAHFECVLNYLHDSEQCAENERIAYIGQGKFAVITDAPPAVQNENRSENRRSAGKAASENKAGSISHTFKIIRTIEWERQTTALDWRSEIAGLFSQTK
ncbi:MAG: hypothetical protein Ta2A_07000 [Treponemataceae bacterium]|nr:MAG: hypothetical protein Ta2A_07000 [Treponemataceae bacterium]